MFRRLVSLATAVIVVGFVAPTVSATPNAPSTGSVASNVLETLPVKGHAAKTGYDRDRFGSAWADTNRNGCDTRNDILTRDLNERGMSGNCTVLTGVLYPDPYTGVNITYTRGKSVIDIDHVVALGNAWVTGAQQLTETERTELANDPLNLLAVSATANRQKGDRDAATWLPANKPYRCAYVARQVAVKAKYALWVTPAEKTAIRNILSTCPGETIPNEGKPAPARTETGAANPQATVYVNCDTARKAGVTPILKTTNPNLYAANTHLDRDRDGRACT